MSEFRFNNTKIGDGSTFNLAKEGKVLFNNDKFSVVLNGLQLVSDQKVEIKIENNTLIITTK